MSVLKIKSGNSWIPISTIQGENGTQGVDGYSPQASVSKSGTTTTITITDKTGTTTATVLDGTNGSNGQNGYTPIKGTDYWTSADKAEIIEEVEITTETVSGTDVSITGVANTRYMCGEVSTISITPPVSGIINVVFTSGSSLAILTLPQTVKMPEWFEMEINRIYEISIMDGVYGAVMSWPL